MGNRAEAFGKKIDEGPNLRRRTAIRGINRKNPIQGSGVVIEPDRNERSRRNLARNQESRLANDALPRNRRSDKRIAIVGVQASAYRHADFLLIAELPASRANAS